MSDTLAIPVINAKICILSCFVGSLGVYTENGHSNALAFVMRLLNCDSISCVILSEIV